MIYMDLIGKYCSCGVYISFRDRMWELFTNPTIFNSSTELHI
jgi:hypothetical protein